MSREQRQHGARHEDRADIMQVPNAPASSSEDAKTRITDFIKKGDGSASEMPKLLKLLTGDDWEDIQTQMPSLGKRMSGAQFLECAAAFDYVVYFAIQIATEDSSPPASNAALRTYLAHRTVEQLVALEKHEGVIAQLRKFMKGPLGVELPALSHLPSEMRDKQHLMRWYLETTPVAIAAVELANAGSDYFAETLDAIDGWSWLDALQIPARYAVELRGLAAGTKKQPIKDKILGMVKQAGDDAVDQDKLKSDATAHLNASINDNMTTADLLDSTARAGRSTFLPEEEMFAQMKGKSADEVLQFALASGHKLSKVLPIVLDAKEVTASHVLALFNSRGISSERVEVLSDDRLRPKVRRVVGRAKSLLDFFPDPQDWYLAHPLIVKDEALRQWVYETNDPRAYLWLATASTDGEKLGVQHVERDKGIKWISQLPADTDPLLLRRYLLATKNDKARAALNELIGDKPIVAEADEWVVEASEPRLNGGGDRARFDVATQIDGASEEEILGRISDLEADERADVVKDTDRMDTALKRVHGENRMRALHLLSPTLTQLFASSLTYTGKLLSYIRSRPVAEEIDACTKASLTKRAREIFEMSPFVVFPILLDPATMGRALDKNTHLLEWIFLDAEPNQALSALSREPARSKVAAALESDYSLYRRFPQYKHLLPDGKAGIDAIVPAIKGDEETEEAKSYQQGDMDADKDVAAASAELNGALKKAHLWDALRSLDDKANPNSALALVRSYPKEQLELLSGAHSEAVEKLRSITYLGPQIVFPSLSTAQLLAAPDAAAWLFGYEAAFRVLSLVGHNATALRKLGSMIDEGAPGIDDFLSRLPKGAGLEANERSILDDLRPHIGDAAKLRKLFTIRFDVEIEGTFDAARTRQLWAVLRRLPPAQIDQKAVMHFRKDKMPGAAGYWDDPDVVVSEDDADFKRPDVAYDNAPLLTKVEIMNYYGLDEAGFSAATTKDGWIEEKSGKYKVKKIHTEKFKATVLHEVGHSIDTLLGERTNLVFDLAGWKNFGLDQVEEWANSMGALDGAGAHKDKIVEAWRQGFRTSVPMQDLVQPGHPAIDPALSHVPLVAAAIDGSFFGHTERREVKGRVGLTGNNQGTIATVPKATADVAPSSYSLHAPGEFFAECYVEYYRDFDGTSATAKTKGGHLPSWIKGWFDEHVDKIELNPQRYKKADEGADGAPAAPVAGKSAGGGGKPG